MHEIVFQKLGFTENEAKLYLELADVGKSTAQLLAKKARVPRTTAYSVLESLVNKGVVSLEQRKATTFYSANSPQSLLRLVQKEKEEIADKEQLAKSLIEEIAPFFKSKNFSVPKLQFFEGRENVEGMLYDYCPEWQQSMSNYDLTWWGYQDHTFVEEYLDWLEYEWPRRLPGETIKLLSNKAPIEDTLAGKVERRIIRAVPEQFHFSSTIWVVGDYIVLLMTGQKPHYAFQMKDSVFAANLRSVFQLLWHSMG